MMLSFCLAPVAPMGTRKSRETLPEEDMPRAPAPEPAAGPPMPDGVELDECEFEGDLE